jgi:eukaryotic-like serine/threonine-protein kinase
MQGGYRVMQAREQQLVRTHDQAAMGRVMGQYRLVRLLGMGGMGQVFLAEHVVLGRLAAVKVLHAELSQQHESTVRFFNEARASAQLRHPGLIEVFDYGWDPAGRAYIVMELLEGASLRSLIERQRVPIVFAVAVAQQVAEAMTLAHAHGIVHRDLKPENLFLVPDPLVPMGCRVKVLDFGIAKLFGRWLHNEAVTRTGHILGTPMYMAPEQCHGAGHVDDRADVYSLGCILFEMLCGRPPFVSDGVGAIIAAHLTEPPVAPSAIHPEVPPELDALVLSMLAKTPETRVASMAELVNRLGELPGMEPQSTDPEVLRWSRTLPLHQVPPQRPGAPLTPVALAPTPAVLMAERLQGTVDVQLATPRHGSLLWSLVTLGVAALATILVVTGSAHAPGAHAEPPAPAPLPVEQATPVDAAIASARADAAPSEVVWRIETNPSGARVMRADDGRELGVTPLELRLPAQPGRVSVLVDKRGYRRSRTELPLDRDASAIVELAREPLLTPAAQASRTRPPLDEPVADGALDPYGE